jgi:hypothetical protein
MRRNDRRSLEAIAFRQEQPDMTRPVRRLLRRSLIAAAASAAIGMAVLTPPSPAAAQGTPEQRAACSDDAQRVCGQYIPDVDRIVACMKRNRRHLSAACRRVMR